VKKLLLPLILLFAMAGVGFSQSPDAVNYQAVARDGSGLLLANQNLDIRIGVYSGASAATLVYEESHVLTTNQFGLFSLKIGEGVVLSGVFSAIAWEGDEHHLKVEVDDGSGYVDLGTNQLVTVPYAFHSRNAEKATNMTLGELTDVSSGSPSTGEVLGWTGSDWSPVPDMAGMWNANGNDIYYDQGYVGIGTTTPGAGLEVSSAAGYGSGIGLNNTGGGTEWRMTSWTDGTLRFVKIPNSTFTAMTIEPTDGKVGIGTSVPDQQLSVHTSSGTSYIRVSDNTTGSASGLRMGLSGSGNAYIINDEANKSLSLGTDGTSQVRITDIGRVGINELTPDMMLHVKQDAANKAIRIEHQSTTDYWENGVGTTTKNYKFYYNNLFRADISSVDGAYTQSSDRRLKRDIEYMDAVLPKIAALKPATYHYVDNTDDAPRSTGFVAQDVQKVFPNLVRDMEDGYKGVVYDGFAVISIKAIQELTEKVTQMQEEIDGLKEALKNE
jgi:hypothetical protein